MARLRVRKEDNYTYKEYYGNFQKIKYDDKKEDYYVTFNKERFYFNDCLRSIVPDKWNNYDVVGTWQEGYCCYLLVADGDISVTERAKVVYCPPAI